MNKKKVEEALDLLGSVPCTFWACPGPDEPAQDMATCYVCLAIHRLREAIGRPTTERKS